MTDPATTPPSTAQREGLQTLLAQMGAVVLSTESIDTTVELVTTLAAETIPGTAGAGISLVDARGKRSFAASGQLVERADALQYGLDAGPCITAADRGITVRVDDLRTDGRWPQWCAAVAPLGIRSALSVPLVASGTSIGAIKVYSYERAAFDERAERVLELFARQAAVLLANALTLTDAHRTNKQLTEALERRDLIGQAKGILLARGAVDDTAAFAMLVTLSQRSNIKLHEVAHTIVNSVKASSARRTTPGQP